MSPVNSHERPPRRDLMMNGIRPSPLKISKESHFIQKPSASMAAAAVSQASSLAAHHPKQRQGPVIIYTHSPKVIHTQARDFMALVQKLTGFSRSDHGDRANETAPPSSSRPRKNKAMDNNMNQLAGASNRQEDNDSSSALTDENGGFGLAVGDGNNASSSYIPTTVSPTTNSFFADIALFTPNSTDFFCSPRLVHKFSDMGNLNSPSLLEFMKGLPDY